MNTANLKIQRGDDENRLIEFTQDDGSPFNLSDVARVDLHAATRSGVVLRLSTEDGSIQLLDEGVNGQMLLRFSHEMTQAETWTQAEYDLQLQFTNGTIKTVLKGNITLIHDVTVVQ